MPLTSLLQNFNEYAVGFAPSAIGVYSLWRNGEIIYYGSTIDLDDGGLQGRLRDHLNGHDGPCTQNATHYQAEATEFPRQREQELIDEFLAQNGRLPVCNKQRVVNQT